MDVLIFGEGSSSSDIIAIGALFVSILSLVATILLSRRQEKRGYMDEFWFREIFAPSCVNPIICFRDKWEMRFAAIGNALINHQIGQELVDEIGVDSAGLLQKIWVAKLFDGDFYTFCEDELDQLEDDFARTLGAAQLRTEKATGAPTISLTDRVTVVCAKILQKAAELHGKGLKIAG